jgi:riboflavin kinase/FMN adenylyltransferase
MIDVAFIRFIRDERKFAGLEALKAQIAEDCLAAKAVLAEAP